MIPFVQPVVGQSAITATAHVNAFAVGTFVFIAGLGYLEVINQSPLELRNPGWPGNAPPATVAPIGTLVIVSGIQGPGDLGLAVLTDGSRPMTNGLRITYPAGPTWNLQHLVLQHGDRDGSNNAQNAGAASIVFLNLNDPANGGQTYGRMRLSNIDSVFEFKHLINENDFFGVRAAGFMTPGQNQGLLLADGATVYKLGGPNGGLMLRCDTTNRQPQIEDSNSLNQRDIIDTINGDVRYLPRSEYDPTDFVTIATAQTITGAKQFTANVTAPFFACPADNQGLVLNDAAVYKLGGSSIILRCPFGNAQPLIEDNSGLPGSRRIILDANNGVRKAGDTMTGPLILPSPMPVLPLEACHKQYVDTLFSGAPQPIGVVNATNGQCRFLVGGTGPIPPPPGANRAYLICDVAGTIPPGGEAPGLTLAVGDWLYSTGIVWTVIAVGGSGATTASAVSLVPNVFGQNNVQAGMQAAETNVTARILRAGDGMTGFLTLAADPTLDLHAATRRYVDSRVVGRGLVQWTTGGDYVVDQGVLYDNRTFRVLVPIPSAPAIPNFTTISPVGWGQSDYWHGDVNPLNWVTDNWVFVATIPAYGTYRVEISNLHVAQDSTLLLDIATSWNTATVVVVGYTHQATGSWSEVRISQASNGAAYRLELRIAANATSMNAKVFIYGEARTVMANQVIIEKPLRASDINLGGNTRAQILDLQEAALTTSGDIITGSGRFVKFYHPNPTDVNDGRIGARLFNRGLSIVGSATEAGDTMRYIGLWGQVEMRQANDFVFVLDNCGVMFSGGSRIYKASGTNIVVRSPTLQIENSDGTNRRQILDANSGVLKAGDTMTGDLRLSQRRFYVDGPNANTTQPALEITGGGSWVRFDGFRTGHYINPEAGLDIFSMSGGYGFRRACRIRGLNGTGDAPLLYADGTVSANDYITRSDASLKQDVVAPAMSETAAIFDALRPVKFRRRPHPKTEGQTIESQPGPVEWGLVANEIQAAAPELAAADTDGTIGYSVTGILALTIAKVRQLEQVIDGLKARLATLDGG